LTPEKLFRLIRAKGLWKLFPTEVRFLFRFEQAAYDEVVYQLLADSGEYVRSLSDHHYRDVYHCQIAGSVLFAMRPNPQLYEALLENSLKIGDPSSCRDAVAAMLQVKSSGAVALDFLNTIEKYRYAANGDEIMARVFDMFYWLGTTPSSLLGNHAWPGYVIGTLYTLWFNHNVSPLSEKETGTGYPFTPPTPPEQAKHMADLILQKMLELFEANNTGQTARSISGILPSPTREEFAPFRERLLQAIQRAYASPDEYVRHRASLLDVRHPE
jgi:hypothetical protein